MNLKAKEQFYKYASSLGIKTNDAQRLMLLAKKAITNKMIEVLFTLNGVEHKQMAIMESAEDYNAFLQYYESEVLGAFPEATNIRLGQCYIGLSES